MNEMTKPYCTCQRRRNDGWTMGPNGTFICPKCRKISKRVWEVTQESCEVAGSNPTSPGTIDVEAKETKEIEMNENTHEHTAFEPDNCPVCGTSADLSTPETRLDEAIANQRELPEDEPGGHSLAYKIYRLRTQLGLSRKQVQDGTGLGASVVWRAEQEGKKVDEKLLVKIWDFLIAVDGDAIKVEKTRKSRNTETSRGATTAQARDEWMAKTWELRGVIDQAHELAVAKRHLAAEAKRSTKVWDELITLLEPHTTEQ